MRIRLFYRTGLAVILSAITSCSLAAMESTPDLLPPEQLQPNRQAIPALAYSQVAERKDLNLLTLQNALLLALHRNPDIMISANNRKVQRYDLLTAQQQFEPQFSISGNTNYTDNNLGQGNVYNVKSATIGPTVNWNFPLGTQLSANLGYGPTTQNGPSGYDSTQTTWTVTLTQPLLQNFGTDVNEVALNNAKDNQIVDDLQLQETVINTLAGVITDYYAMVQAQHALEIANASLQQSQITLKNREALLKAGRIPRLDITQAEIDIATQQQSLAEAQQTLVSAKGQLLNDLGLPGDTIFTVDDNIDIQQLQPGMQSALELAAKNNLDLQIAEIQYREQQRNLLTSQNQNRWQLNLQLQDSHTITNTNYDDPLATPNTSVIADNKSASLNLSIPLNSVTMDQNTLSAATAMQNQEITMLSQQQTLKTSVLTAIQNLNSQWTSLQVSQQNLDLSNTNYKAAEIKFKYGQIDAFSLSQQQQQLIQAQINLVNAKIAYIQQVLNYEKLLGTLLDIWHIQFEVPTHA